MGDPTVGRHRADPARPTRAAAVAGAAGALAAVVLAFVIATGTTPAPPTRVVDVAAPPTAAAMTGPAPTPAAQPYSDTERGYLDGVNAAGVELTGAEATAAVVLLRTQLDQAGYVPGRQEEIRGQVSVLLPALDAAAAEIVVDCVVLTWQQTR